MARPSLATISSNVSKYVPSVVSLYGAHRAKVRKSNMAVITRAPVPRSWKQKRLRNRHQTAQDVVHDAISFYAESLNIWRQTHKRLGVIEKSNFVEQVISQKYC